MHRVRFDSLIILAVSAISVVAQTPTAPQPDGRRLRLGSDSLEVYIIRMGQPQRTGYLIDRLDTVRVNGETMLRRVYRTTDTVLGSSVDTLVDTLATLQPQGYLALSRQRAASIGRWIASSGSSRNPTLLRDRSTHRGPKDGTAARAST